MSIAIIKNILKGSFYLITLCSGELPLSGTTFKKVVSFPNNVRSETIQSTLQGKTLTLSGETDPTKTDGFLSGGFGRGGFSDPFESNASKVSSNI